MSYDDQRDCLCRGDKLLEEQRPYYLMLILLILRTKCSNGRLGYSHFWFISASQTLRSMETWGDTAQMELSDEVTCMWYQSCNDILWNGPSALPTSLVSFNTAFFQSCYDWKYSWPSHILGHQQYSLLDSYVGPWIWNIIFTLTPFCIRRGMLLCNFRNRSKGPFFLKLGLDDTSGSDSNNLARIRQLI